MKIKNLLNCTRPVFFENEHSEYYAEYPYSCGGTAFLASLNGQTYALSAKHVAKRFPIEAARLLVTIDKADFFPFDQRAVLKSKDGSERDFVDLAIWRLDLALIGNPNLGEFGPIDLGAVGMRSTPDDDWSFLFQGYPTDRTRVDYEKKKLVAVGVAMQADYLEPADQAHCHLMRVRDLNGIPAETFDGCSGSPVFCIQPKEAGKHRFAFSGVIIRGDRGRGLLQYIGAEVIIEALRRLQS